MAEIPADVPDARFALPSTIHWIKGLAILVADLKVDLLPVGPSIAQSNRGAYLKPNSTRFSNSSYSSSTRSPR
jgi:hypothetical protein